MVTSLKLSTVCSVFIGHHSALTYLNCAHECVRACSLASSSTCISVNISCSPAYVLHTEKLSHLKRSQMDPLRCTPPYLPGDKRPAFEMSLLIHGLQRGR